ncbi:MAG: winged helix DNA-binding protein [Achromobacter sp.]|uniref:winged helix DNA-binding protein n=1 Tax=Achromobacter sp. TaxID=134375 RepID=UPI003CFE7D3A
MSKHRNEGQAERGRGAASKGVLRILSAAHLAEGAHPELSELEFGIIVANNAFQRWITRCMAAAGAQELGPTDILVLHHVHHRGRGKRLMDICFTLNYEDTHVVNYALKKLVGLSLIEGARGGKEVFYATTAAGGELLARFREVRKECLLQSVDSELDDAQELARIASRLRFLSGIYDQAARAASSL